MNCSHTHTCTLASLGPFEFSSHLKSAIHKKTIRTRNVTPKTYECPYYWWFRNPKQPPWPGMGFSKPCKWDKRPTSTGDRQDFWTINSMFAFLRSLVYSSPPSSHPDTYQTTTRFPWRRCRTAVSALAKCTMNFYRWWFRNPARKTTWGWCYNLVNNGMNYLSTSM